MHLLGPREGKEKNYDYSNVMPTSRMLMMISLLLVLGGGCSKKDQASTETDKQKIAQTECDPALNIGDFKNGYAIASSDDGKQFHVRENDCQSNYAARFDWVSDFYEGLARVGLKDDIFHINKYGQPAYEERYEWVGDFKNGFATARERGKHHHITPDGKPAYEERYHEVGDFNNGRAPARIGLQQFHITPDGKPAYSERYDAVDDFRGGFAVVEKDGKVFHIRQDGQPLYAMRFDLIADFFEGSAKGWLDDRESGEMKGFKIDSTGKITPLE